MKKQKYKITTTRGQAAVYLGCEYGIRNAINILPTLPCVGRVVEIPALVDGDLSNRKRAEMLAQRVRGYVTCFKARKHRSLRQCAQVYVDAV